MRKANLLYLGNIKMCKCEITTSSKGRRKLIRTNKCLLHNANHEGIEVEYIDKEVLNDNGQWFNKKP